MHRGGIQQGIKFGGEGARDEQWEKQKREREIGQGDTEEHCFRSSLFAGKFYGGQTVFIYDFCQAITSCHSWQKRK